MVDPSLVAYVKENLVKGYASAQIRDTLIGSGWQPADVDAALKEGASSNSVSLPSATPTVPAQNPVTSETKPAPTNTTAPSSAPSSAFPTAAKPTEKPFYEPKKFGMHDALIIAAMVIVFAGIGAVIYFLFLVN